MSERCSLCVAYGKDVTGDGFLCCSDDSKRLLLSLSDDFVCQPPFSVICLSKYKDKVIGGSPHAKIPSMGYVLVSKTLITLMKIQLNIQNVSCSLKSSHFSKKPVGRIGPVCY